MDSIAELSAWLTPRPWRCRADAALKHGTCSCGCLVLTAARVEPKSPRCRILMPLAIVPCTLVDGQRSSGGWKAPRSSFRSLRPWSTSQSFRRALDGKVSLSGPQGLRLSDAPLCTETGLRAIPGSPADFAAGADWSVGPGPSGSGLSPAAVAGHLETVGQSDSGCAASRRQLHPDADVLPFDYLVTLMESVHDDDADQ